MKRILFLFAILMCSLLTYSQVKSDAQIQTYNDTYISYSNPGGIILASQHNLLEDYIIQNKIHRDSLDNVWLNASLDTLFVQYKDQAVDTVPLTAYAGYWVAASDDISNNNAGNVGIGTGTPSQDLEVAGDLLVQDTTFYGTTANWRSQNYIGSTGTISFKSGATTTTTISPVGRVVITDDLTAGGDDIKFPNAAATGAPTYNRLAWYATTGEVFPYGVGYGFFEFDSTTIGVTVGSADTWVTLTKTGSDYVETLAKNVELYNDNDTIEVANVGIYRFVADGSVYSAGGGDLDTLQMAFYCIDDDERYHVSEILIKEADVVNFHVEAVATMETVDQQVILQINNTTSDTDPQFLSLTIFVELLYYDSGP